MGYYLQAPTNLNKADYFVKEHGAQKLSKIPESFKDIPKGKTFVGVVSNGMFEACGIAYDSKEFDSFKDPRDTRPLTCLLMDTELVKKLCPAVESEL